jgi:hypothetical protein
MLEGLAIPMRSPGLQASIHGVRHYASQLYSDDGYEGAQGFLYAAQALRLKALNALSAFRGRLNILEPRPRSVPELPALQVTTGTARVPRCC